MSKSNTTEQDILDLVFLKTDPAWRTNGNAYVALHTGDPGEAGTQTTNEATYPGYGRATVARDAGGWSRTGSTTSNVADVTFAEATGGPETITHWSYGLLSSGAGQILYKGALNASLVVNNLVTPRFPAGQLQTTED